MSFILSILESLTHPFLMFVDASKVPPSRFQKRKGSIYAVPKTRDGHVDNNYAHAFHQKHMEKGYHNVK